MGLSYEEFKRIAADLAGVDLSAYKSQQMDRRLNSLMSSWGLASYDEYLMVLQTDEARFNEFKKKITINVSEFFRNPDRFRELSEIILPDLYLSGRRLRIWSAGCSNGAEPYTLAIIIRESGYMPGARIIGTDIDREILRRAHLAHYTPNEVKCVAPHLLTRYFRPLETGGYALCEEVKRMVDLKEHDLLLEDGEPDCDLILCRNVVIYFTEAAKNALYPKLVGSLRLGGYLMVGGTEPLLNFKEYSLENPLTAFYRKVALPGGEQG